MRDLKFTGIPMKSENLQIVKPGLGYEDNTACLAPLLKDVL